MVALAVALSHTGRCADAHTIEEAVTKRLKGDVPKENVFLGAALILSAGLIIIVSERLRRARAVSLNEAES